MRILIVTLVLCFASLAAAQGQDDPREVARQHYKTGEAKFRAGDFRAAMVSFLAADAIAPSAQLVYNVALCHERLGESAEAARRYREYLARRKDAPNRAEIEGRIATLEAAARSAQPLPPEYPDGDGVAQPRSLGPDPMAPGAAQQPPVRRPYDEAFARLVPGADTAAPAPQGEAEQAPLAAAEPPPPTAQYPQPSPVREPIPGPPQRKEKPLYKQWWFWVFVGVGAVILIDVVATSSGGDQDAAKPASGLTLIKF